MPRPKGDPLRQNVYVSAGVIKIGDFVTLNASGQVAVATASQALVGVANAYASGAGQEIQVMDHPDQMFLVGKDGTEPSAQTDFNLNYNIVAATSTSRESAHVLDSSTGDTTATLPLKALDRSRQLAMSAAEVVVVINNHQLKGGTGTAGV